MIEHITIVSINGSKIATIPSLTGCSAFAAAWAMGAEPCPASLENNPRLTPLLKAYAMVAPKKPPEAADPLKTSAKMLINEGIIFS